MLSIFKPFVRFLLFIGKLSEITSGIEFAVVVVVSNYSFTKKRHISIIFRICLIILPFKNLENEIKFITLPGSVIVNSSIVPFFK